MSVNPGQSGGVRSGPPSVQILSTAQATGATY